MTLPPKPKKVRAVYLDHAAATPLHPQVFSAMKPFLIDTFANPSALYSAAVHARNAVEHSRSTIAKAIGAQPKSVFFTGSGTESCNLAIRGTVEAARRTVAKPHIVTSTIEHHAVLRTVQQLEKEGCSVTYVEASADGLIAAEDVLASLTSQTVLVSIMLANNEVGSIQPVAHIGNAVQKWRRDKKTQYPLFHSDACQAANELRIDVEQLHVDLLTLNASKVYGPKGVGLLYARTGTPIDPVLLGGGQEFGLRPGTEYVAGIVGFAKALSLAQKQHEHTLERLRELQQYFLKHVFQSIPEASLVGTLPGRKRLASNISILFPNTDAESLILYLDAYGISCASASACTTGSDEISHVLTACGLDEKQAQSVIRFTMGKATTKKDINHLIKYLVPIVKMLHTNDV